MWSVVKVVKEGGSEKSGGGSRGGDAFEVEDRKKSLRNTERRPATTSKTKSMKSKMSC